MRRFFALATTLVLGCATGAADEDVTAPKPADAGAAESGAEESSVVDGSSPIFPVEDAPPANDTTVVATDSAPPPDTAVADTAVADTEEPDTAPATLTLTINTLECRVITCPATFPHVIGCNVAMGGLSSQGCAVHGAGTSTITFKEGQSCGDISVSGTVTCGTSPVTSLNTTNCTMNKGTPLYVTFIGSCPN